MGHILVKRHAGHKASKKSLSVLLWQQLDKMFKEIALGETEGKSGGQDAMLATAWC